MKTKIFYDFEATSISRDADIVSVGLVAVTLIEEGYRFEKDIHYKNEEIKTFYAEFHDFSLDKSDEWVKENIIKKLRFKEYLQRKSNLLLNTSPHYFKTDTNIELVGNTDFISNTLKDWLSQFESIEFWSDFDVIDKPMLIDLIAEWNIEIIHRNIEIDEDGYNKKICIYEHEKVGLPKHLPNVKYDQFFDLHTYLKIKGVDTDVNRETFVKSELTKESVFGKDFNNPPFSEIIGEKHHALWDAYVNWKVYEKLNN